jgi:AcrR family transcriptional regulator
MLLEAALKRFGAEGYDAPTTRSIAADAGVSEVVLFRHFPSKRELFLAVIGEFGPRELFRHLPSDLRRERSAVESLRSLVTDYLDTTWKHRSWLRVLFQEAGRDPEAARALRGQYRRVGQALQAILRDGAASGEFREDICAAAMQVIALAVRGFIARNASRRPKDWETERDAFVGNLMSVVAEGLRAPQDDTKGVREQ